MKPVGKGVCKLLPIEEAATGMKEFLCGTQRTEELAVNFQGLRKITSLTHEVTSQFAAQALCSLGQTLVCWKPRGFGNGASREGSG